MPQVATGAHLAGTLVLAFFFVLLARSEERRYLREWTAAWAAQALALGLALPGERGRALTGLGLFLHALHGLLLLAAAGHYAGGRGLARAHVFLLVPLALACGASPLLFREEWGTEAARFGTLAACYLAAAGVLWPKRAPRHFGLRLTADVLVLAGTLFLLHAAVFAWAFRSDWRTYMELAPFGVLFLQMLLGLGMVTAAMEETQERLEAAQERLRLLAETDPLTGCFNRRVFRELVDSVRRDGSSHGAVIVLDVDGLKAINDVRGHAAGDEAIRAIAEALRSRTRTTDLVVRWGGDEFVVVLPGASAPDAEARRAQIAEAVAARGLSASSGLASYGPGADVVAAVQEADAEMYQAKQGRKAAAAQRA